MCEIKWIKITTNIFHDEGICLIDSMPEGDAINCIWFKLLVLAGKTNANGLIFLKEDMPYTDEMLSIIFNRNINIIRLALKTLQGFEMIEIMEDNTINIVNWEKHQNVESMDRIREQTRKRVQKHRKRKNGEVRDEDIIEGKDNCSQEKYAEKCNVTETQQKEKEETDIDIDKKKKKDKEETLESESKQEKDRISQVNDKSIKLLAYYEKITGRLGIFSLEALSSAIIIHGEEHVKMAIEKAIEVNIVTMKYVNGILKNWVKEGYPEEVLYEGRKSMLPNSNEFKGFKPKEPRVLTDEERREIESKLI